MEPTNGASDQNRWREEALRLFPEILTQLRYKVSKVSKTSGGGLGCQMRQVGGQERANTLTGTGNRVISVYLVELLESRRSKAGDQVENATSSSHHGARSS